MAFSLEGTKPLHTGPTPWLLLQLSVSHTMLRLTKGESEASRKASCRRRLWSSKIPVGVPNVWKSERVTQAEGTAWAKVWYEAVCEGRMKVLWP